MHCCLALRSSLFRHMKRNEDDCNLLCETLQKIALLAAILLKVIQQEYIKMFFLC